MDCIKLEREIKLYPSKNLELNCPKKRYLRVTSGVPQGEISLFKDRSLALNFGTILKLTKLQISPVRMNQPYLVNAFRGQYVRELKRITTEKLKC